MSYEVQEINNCTKKIVFDFDQVDLSDKVESALAEKQKSTTLKGFRKGKAPLQMIREAYGPQVEHEALSRFVSEQFIDAIEKENLRAVGTPEFGNTKYEPGKKISFEATVEIFPEFEIKDFSHLSFEVLSDEVNLKEVENVKQRLLDSKSSLEEVKEEGAQLKSTQTAVFNFEGERANGERPDNMKGEEFALEIGSGQFIPGFEDQMIGMKTGEKKTIEVEFPSDYQAEDLQGEKVKFDIELLEIKEKKTPEWTDELAKEFDFENTEDFEKKTLERLKNEKKRQIREKLNREILDKLLDENPFEVPAAFIKEQKEALMKDASANLKQRGATDSMVAEYFNKWAEDLDKQAVYQVKTGLLMDRLGKDFEVESTDADIESKIEEMASANQADIAEVKDFYQNNENMKKNLSFAIREEKTFDKILEKVTVNIVSPENKKDSRATD